MTERVHHHPNLIYSPGTQVVTLKDVLGSTGRILHPQGAVGVVIHTTPEHEELKAVAADCITRHHAHHYSGFAETQWKLFEKEDPPKVKPLLYVYRVLLTGIHLMRTGEVEANLVRLNESAELPYLPELIDRKVNGTEKGRVPAADLTFHRAEYERLRAELERAYEESRLPDRPSGGEALNGLLVRLRLRKRQAVEM